MPEPVKKPKSTWDDILENLKASVESAPEPREATPEEREENLKRRAPNEDMRRKLAVPYFQGKRDKP